MNNDKLILQISALDKNILLADGFNDAVIGLTYRDDELVALYSKEKIIQILIHEQDMTCEDAIEYFEYNIEGSYVGKKTPVYYSFYFEDEEGADEWY